MRALFSTVIVAFLCATAHAEPTQAQLERVLGGIERVASADEVRALGAGTDRALMRYADDSARAPLRRRRAVAQLLAVPSSEARAWLLQRVELQRGSSDWQTQQELAAAAGALRPYGEEVLPVLTSLLAHASPDVRAAAALSLGDMANARPALSARLGVERDANVRAALTRALRNPSP